MVIGLISCFEESGRISRAVESLFAAGCDRVVCVDGAWTAADGRPFAGRGPYSNDFTGLEAVDAGAEWVEAALPIGSDGEKRNQAIHLAGAAKGDHLFLLDADETLDGTLPEDPPWGHATVLLRNLAANDLPGIRGTFPNGDHSDRPIPLLRWIRWSPELRCTAPGRYLEGDAPVEPYLVNLMRDWADEHPVLNQAYAALREVGEHVPAELASWLPILDGVEIQHHGNVAKTDAKRAYYEATV